MASGLPLVERPFAAIGARVGLDEAAVIATLEGAIESGIVKRIGYVVRHRPLGFSSNAMVVFDVGDDEVDRVAETFLDAEAVTLLYRRRRAGGRWPYSLYAMIHGRERAVVERQVGDLVARWPRPLVHRILFSTRCFKQTGARLAS